ncbi:MAG: DNA polymerase, partial [Alphaproteobacteria bacterium]|nr:DNA polymerase [Alphaproteobacteria bacterium]
MAADMFPPTSNWQRLAELPDLRRVGRIAIDLETKDDRLRASMGSGWPHRMGHVAGVSVAYRADDNVVGDYLPIRHPDTDNFPAEQIYAWLRDLIAAGVRIVGHNLHYDLGWVRAESGIVMPAGDRLDDTLFMAVMADENRYTFRLDDLCKWRGLPGKDEALLQEAVRALIGGKKRGSINAKEHLHALPAPFVGPYAERDAISTLLLADSIAPILEHEGTQSAYELERDLMPMVQEMRWRGVRIDLAAAERNRDLLLAKRDAALAELSKELSVAVSMDELRDKKWLVAQFDKAGVEYKRTEKGNPSFTGGKAGWMDGHPHPLPRLKAVAHRYDNAAVTHGYSFDKLLAYAVNGRLHAEIHQLKSEDAANGAVSCRIIYSNPPLQQMPARDEEMAPLFRGVFLPEEGEAWAAPDVSQQEFRFAVHFADQHHLRDADKAVRRYQENPDADFHALVGEMTGLSRVDAKQINFGKIYGMGPQKFADVHKKTEEQAKALFAQYDRELPFLKLLSDLYKRRAVKDGHVALYDGARRHFNRWAPGGTWSKGAGPCELEEAERRKADPTHPWYRKQLFRTDTKDALNALIQGSAARHTKLWMRAVWREGVVPLLQLHDALHCSVSSREQGEMIARLGEEAVKLRVPMRVDLKFGRTWGDAKHVWDDIPRGSCRSDDRRVEPPPNAPTHVWRSKDTDFPVTLTGRLAAHDGEPLVEVIYRDKDGEHRNYVPKAEVLTIDEAKAPPEHPCIPFLKALHHASTGPVFVTSLLNNKNRDPVKGGDEQKCVGRDWTAAADFARQWDKPKRALYVAVNALRTGATTRSKDPCTIGEITCLFGEIDLKDLDYSLDDARAAIARLACQPTIIVFSGHG